MTHQPAGPLAQRAIKAVAWGYGGTAARMIVQVGAQAVLARMLGPEEFGVFAAMLLLTAVAVLAADLVSAPVIHAPELSPDLLRFACATQWTGASVMALLVLTCLPVYEALFPTAQQLPLSFALLALGTFATGWSGVSMSLLRRELQYREIQLAQLTGYVIGYVVLAIPLALLGLRGHLVLVLAWLGQSVVTSAALYAYKRHSWHVSFSYSDRRHFLTYGWHVTLGNLANWLTSSVDRLLVTRFAGPTDIGYYNTMLNLSFTPVHQLTASLNTVAFSMSAQAQHASRKEGSVIYLNMTALGFGLLYALVASFPSEWISLLYGQGWVSAAAFIPPFCIAAVSFGIGAAANAVLTSTGRASSAAKTQLVTVVSVVLAVGYLVQSSALWAAWGLAAVYMARGLVLAAQALQLLGVGRRRLGRAVLLPLLCSWGVVQGARHSVEVVGASGILAALIACGVTLLVTLGGVVFFRRYVLPIESVRWVDSRIARLRKN